MLSTKNCNKIFNSDATHIYIKLTEPVGLAEVDRGGGLWVVGRPRLWSCPGGGSVGHSSTTPPGATTVFFVVGRRVVVGLGVLVVDTVLDVALLPNAGLIVRGVEESTL